MASTLNPISSYPGGFTNGVAIRNMPVLSQHAGNTYWVDSNGGGSSRGTFSRPFLTIAAAIAACTANNGDVIMVKAGHAETISDTTGFLVNKAGITIIGLGAGGDRPTFTYSATGSVVSLASASTVIQNLKLLASVSAVAVGVDVDAANCGIYGCEFAYDATGDDFVIAIDIEDVNQIDVIGNSFNLEATAGTTSGVSLDGSDYTVVSDNWFFGDFGSGAIFGDTTSDTGDGASVCVGLRIEGNRMYTSDTDAQGPCINLNHASTGIIAHNLMGNNDGAGGATNVSAKLDPGSCLCFENYAVDTIDQSAILVPTTTAADT